MPFSTSYTNEILNAALGRVKAVPEHTYVYMGVSTNDPEADDGTFTELSGGNYARVLISQVGEEYPGLIGIANSRVIRNAKQINFNKATSAWSIKGIGLFSAASGGSPFYYASLGKTVTVAAGAVLLFDPGTFSIGLKDQDEEMS